MDYGILESRIGIQLEENLLQSNNSSVNLEFRQEKMSIFSLLIGSLHV